MSIQTSDADLKTEQEQPLSGITLLAITDSAADAYIFNSPLIGGNLGSSSHPIRCSGVVQALPGVGGTSYLYGNLEDLNLSASDYDGFASDGLNYVWYLSGNTPTLELFTYNQESSNTNGVSIQITTDQTTSLEAALSSYNNFEQGCYITLYAPNASSFNLSSCNFGTDNYGGIDIEATYVPSVTICDFTYYMGLYNGFVLECNSTSPVLPSAFGFLIGYPAITLNGPFDVPTVNQILALCVTGGMNGGSLTIGGTSASPTGQGITDKATLISNGVSVSTN